MRMRTIAMLVVMSGAALGASHAAAAPTYGSETLTYKIPTRAGTLHAEVVHATLNGKIAKVPAILTLSPYSALGRNGDATRWVPKGYHRVWVDLPGTGDSGGCFDYGAAREKKAGYDSVEWIAKQK
ncbi:MAG TPA: CocE/NonD family hydrolase, partial [Actinomycetota bacterium]|nr:CocE/NonD family hydrolase [Actinomycetota bacterium]